MKRLVQILSVAVGLILIAGCDTTRPTVSFVPAALPLTNATYAIGRFVDGNSEENRRAFPEAATVTASAFETALMQAGYRIVNVGGEDITVCGIVTAFYQGRFAGANTTVGLDVKAVEKKTGTVLWKASHSKTSHWEYDVPPHLLAPEIAQEMVQQILVAGKPR